MWSIKDCVYEYARRRGIPRTQAKEEFKILLDVITEACVNNGGVFFRNTFTLKKVLRKGKSGIINGKKYQSSDRYILRLTTGSKFNDLLNSKK